MLDYGSRFAKFVLTGDVRAKKTAHHVSEKTRELHAAGVDRIGQVTENAKNWADKKVQGVENRIGSGIKTYEIARDSVKHGFTEMKSFAGNQRAMEQKRAELMKQLAELNAQMGESNA
ncbi:MAG: hypothetical protein A2751_01725 [Candidatus Doudnabacteria bacterium RIFCSPHIGHO2_01_FULL_46_14]|uniref:Uncharacterized protein n=1 Tax=Candidatus Doudnabacteria bacterium RIFCSPHIGHO2_01_FULL_46_14 TaxID=1817824 RepID=A0A1F5NJD3_9BACT|nr:MAG: hypothetical protein A2751_01725 [Candidatus Doudnabacteria bacterium RIFCSPHIGHO2_01_FULL_46_14]